MDMRRLRALKPLTLVVVITNTARQFRPFSCLLFRTRAIFHLYKSSFLRHEFQCFSLVLHFRFLCCTKLAYTILRPWAADVARLVVTIIVVIIGDSRVVIIIFCYAGTRKRSRKHVESDTPEKKIVFIELINQNKRWLRYFAKLMI